VLNDYVIQDVGQRGVEPGRNLIVIIGALVARLVNQVLEKVVMHRVAVASGG